MVGKRAHNVLTRIASAMCLACLTGLAPGFVLPETLPKKTYIQDLHYGEVLFYYYQDDFFTALTHLQAARMLQRLPNHGEEAELLLGGLFLSYGQHNEAGAIFRRLLDGNVSESVANRAWFYLAKIWYQRGYYDESRDALSRITRPLPGDLEFERHMMAAQVLMHSGRYAEAADILAGWDAPADWKAYAQFNLGVAMVRQERVSEAAELLNDVGSMRVGSEELKSLKDKANVALGFAYLQGEQGEQAKPPLQRVRLEGPFSNKALLGVGWADSAAGRYRKALVPWMELRRRDLLDPAVQESLLAIPYAFGQLQANNQAAEHYLNAIEAFIEEMQRLDSSIANIRSGKFLDILLANDTENELGWFWHLQNLPQAPETRYLYHLLAEHDFQEALKNYRDLRYLERNLNHWIVSVEAFQDMLDTRQARFDQRMPVINESLGRVDLDEINSRRLELQSRIAAISASNNAIELGTAAELRQWQELNAIAERMDILPDDPAISEVRDKHRFLKGVMIWNANENYKARLWRERKTLKELGAGLKEAKRHHTLVERARDEQPERHAMFSARIAAIDPKIESLRQRVMASIELQNNYLEKLAIRELEAQKRRLETYMVQARFALATIFDRSANAEITP